MQSGLAHIACLQWEDNVKVVAFLVRAPSDMLDAELGQ